MVVDYPGFNVHPPPDMVDVSITSAKQVHIVQGVSNVCVVTSGVRTGCSN